MFNRGQSQCGSYAIVSVDDKLHVDFFDSRTQKGGALPVHSDYRSGKGERFDMKSEMERDILKVLVTEEELKARITEMGAELYEQFHGKNPLFLGVLKGSFVFMADLVRACQVKSDVEFIAVSSYRQGCRRGIQRGTSAR